MRKLQALPLLELLGSFKVRISLVRGARRIDESNVVLTSSFLDVACDLPSRVCPCRRFARSRKTAAEHEHTDGSSKVAIKRRGLKGTKRRSYRWLQQIRARLQVIRPGGAILRQDPVMPFEGPRRAAGSSESWRTLKQTDQRAAAQGTSSARYPDNNDTVAGFH